MFTDYCSRYSQVTVSSLLKFEKLFFLGGKREMPMHLFIILADYYNVSLDYLAGRRLKNKKSPGHR